MTYQGPKEHNIGIYNANKLVFYGTAKYCRQGLNHYVNGFACERSLHLILFRDNSLGKVTFQLTLFCVEPEHMPVFVLFIDLLVVLMIGSCYVFVSFQNFIYYF